MWRCQQGKGIGTDLKIIEIGVQNPIRYAGYHRKLIFLGEVSFLNWSMRVKL